MKRPIRQKIVIIGCGSVAWHLAKHLNNLKKYQIFVYNHKSNPLLNEFKSVLKCRTETTLDHIITDATYYFVCVTDKFITETAKKISVRNPNALLVHTSGSMKLKELGKRIHDTGVFYPLQTFSKHVDVDWSRVPVIIESANPRSKILEQFATQFTKTVVYLGYKERLKLHLCAVLVNNFTNALYVTAFDLIKENADRKNLDFDLLLPLIKQTTSKIEKVNPHAAQTGPARRKDEVVMNKHLAILSGKPELKKLYKQLSKLIVNQQY
jgi:predicted short-subunit dehydrogenase-like oxidoreductase (DUF2520 family)